MNQKSRKQENRKFQKESPLTATLIEKKIFTRMRVYMKQNHLGKGIQN